MNNLRRLDLNLLVTLDVLLAEHNVTRTAERLNFSQPSVSVHLAKLRDIFDDPLLIPGPRGMRPTARAEELREPLRLALEALEQAVAPASPFDPGAAQNVWRIAASDYGESAIVLPALAGLRSAAPGGCDAMRHCVRCLHAGHAACAESCWSTWWRRARARVLVRSLRAIVLRQSPVAWGMVTIWCRLGSAFSSG